MKDRAPVRAALIAAIIGSGLGGAGCVTINNREGSAPTSSAASSTTSTEARIATSTSTAPGRPNRVFDGVIDCVANPGRTFK